MDKQTDEQTHKSDRQTESCNRKSDIQRYIKFHKTTPIMNIKYLHHTLKSSTVNAR